MVLDIYPMPLFIKLIVNNVKNSCLWYEEVLGFQKIFTMKNLDDELSLAHIRLSKHQDLLLSKQVPEFLPSFNKRGQGVIIYINLFDQSIESLVKKLTSKGTVIISELENKPWNTREFIIQDPDGYQIAFSQVIDPDKNFSEVLKEKELI